MSAPSPMPPDSPRPPKLSRATAMLVGVLLIIPCVALAAVPLYSRETPVLWGWPFFYWYQVAWVVITPILTYSAYVIVQRARGDR
ncbi:MAG: DUF3311 domain-containing protein [Actinomycetota bacterium]|nr:DUF3311 domain-containing protein [Actinomycetota bacterium]